MKYANLIAMALACSAALAHDTAHAVQGVFFEQTKITAYRDPYFIPQNHTTNGMFSFWYASNGQINDGYVALFDLMYSEDNYTPAARIQFSNSFNVEDFCPYLHVHPELLTDGSNWLETWNAQDCPNRPDITLHNSGRLMRLEFILTSDYGFTNYLIAVAELALPQDNLPYNVQIYYSTGDGDSDPWVKYIVNPQGDPAGGTLTDINQIAWNGSGWDVPLENKFWQLGCHSSDAQFGNTCYTGALANFFFFPSGEAVIPYPTTIAAFITPEGYAEDIGPDGQYAFGLPTTEYLKGGDLAFVHNSADLAAPDVVPQFYETQGLHVTNDNYDFTGGILYTDWRDF